MKKTLNKIRKLIVKVITVLAGLTLVFMCTIEDFNSLWWLVPTLLSGGWLVLVAYANGWFSWRNN